MKMTSKLVKYGLIGLGIVSLGVILKRRRGAEIDNLAVFEDAVRRNKFLYTDDGIHFHNSTHGIEEGKRFFWIELQPRIKR